MRRGRLYPTLQPARKGAAVVELAILLPVLLFFVAVAVDYCRVFYYSLTIKNAACAGALYGSRDATHAADSAKIQAAAQADATNLSPAPNVTSATGTDADGNPTVSVTVTYSFATVANYVGVPGTANLSHTVTMRVLP